MDYEQRYCRAPLARWFNSQPCSAWIPNRNNSTDGHATYISGVPDAFVCWNGQFIAVECKAGAGSIFLGDPWDKENTSGWHWHQRNWHEKVAVPSNMAYWIAAWLYSEREPERVYNKDAQCYLIPPGVWIATEQKLHPDRKTLSASPDLERVLKFKNTTAQSEFAGYELVYQNQAWAIPEQHPFWSKEEACQQASLL